MNRTDDPASTPEADALTTRLGHGFADRALLELALTHRSWCAENPGYDSNERLEFLGDAVLGLSVTDCIYRTYAAMPEGELAKLRATVVSTVALAETALDLDLGAVVRLGKGEAASGGREKASILADTLEAVIGAVYVDAGWEAARPFVISLIGDRIIEAVESGPGGLDFKTKLQEHVARRFETLPVYVLTDEGPDHDKRFDAEVFVDGTLYGRGEGRSKKRAEQSAARDALAALTAFTALDASFDDEEADPPPRRFAGSIPDEGSPNDVPPSESGTVDA